MGDPDLICLTEMHLCDSEVITVNNYTYFGLNRKTRDKRALRNSGGIGILVKNNLCGLFQINDCYRWNDNVLGIKLESIDQTDCIIVYCVYMPPESSKYSVNNEELLNNLTIDIYLNHNADKVIICCDFNARVGSKLDTLNDENICERKVIDHISNKQGDRLLTFVQDIKGCLVNGRITPESDDFTSCASHKGLAVVDYFITRQSDLATMTKMTVAGMSKLVEQADLEHLLSDRAHMPDHSLLTLSVELSLAVTERLCENTLGSKTVKKGKIFRTVGDEYMESGMAVRLLNNMLVELASMNKQQEDMDLCYDGLVNFLLDQAAYSVKNRMRKRPDTTYKLYWDEELSKKWKKMKEAERIYHEHRKHHKNKCNNWLCLDFKITQSI